VDRIYHATLNSIRGLRAALRTDAAVREELLLLMAAFPVGWVLAPSFGWFVAMIAVVLVVLAVELLNTAVEKLADHVTPHHHPQIGTIKDMGSTAVFFALVLAALVWLGAIAVKFGLY
jgi:diacylglycerol kinase (ATP)